jgi:hypothetical protein
VTCSAIMTSAAGRKLSGSSPCSSADPDRLDLPDRSGKADGRASDAEGQQVQGAEQYIKWPQPSIQR